MRIVTRFITGFIIISLIFLVMGYFFTIKKINISKTNMLIICYFITLATTIIYSLIYKNILKPINDIFKQVYEILETLTKNENFNSKIVLNKEFNKLPCHLKQIITEFKQTNVSKEYLYNIFKSIIDSLVVISPDKTIKKTNKATCDLLNYDMEELIGKNIDEIFASGEFTFDGSRHYESYYRTKDNTIIPVLLSVSRITENKELKALVLTARDITESKKAENEKKKWLSLMEAVIESTDNGILVVDRYQNIAKVNQRFLEIAKIKEVHDFKDKTLFDCLFDCLASPNEFSSTVQKLFDTPEEKSSNTLYFKVGRIFKCYSRPMYIENVPKGRVWCLHEITKERQHKLELTRIKTAIDSASEAIAISTEEGQHFYQNKAFTKLFGYTLKEYQKLPILSCYADRKQTNKVFESIKKYNTWEGEIKAKTCNNKIFPALACVNAAKNDEGKIVGLIHTYIDITKQKQNEKQLHEALKRADDMAVKAETANIAKSKFLANVSHEIRTPMNGIIGMSDILLDTKLRDKQFKYAKMLKNSATSLLSIINDILDFSKIEAGKLEIDNFDFNIYNMIEDFASTMSFRLQEKNIEFICILEPGTPDYFKGDAGRICQVLNNLVGNAIKFTNNGTIKVYGKVKESTNKEITLFFSVQDTGIGVPADKKVKLFESFFQANDSLNRKYSGTGLGLAISKQLVTIMDGEIGVNSVENKGSEFWFTVKVSPSGKQTVSFKCEHLKNLKFLVIDDNESNLDILKKQLNYWDIICNTTNNAFTALEELKEAYEKGESYHIAIIDDKMPGIDGESLSKLIKNDEKIKNTKLIMMKKSSSSKPEDTRRLLNIGFSSCIDKPVKQSELFSSITKVIGISHKITNKKQKIEEKSYDIFKKNRKVKVLLVEDNIINQHVARAILEKLGHSVKIANNGKEAIDQLRLNFYDIIFMDIQMPVMDGMEATREIRKQNLGSQNGKIPIIAVTAHAMKGDQEKFIAVGMDDYISKPIGPKKIAELLYKWSKNDKQNNNLEIQDKNSNMEETGLGKNNTDSKELEYKGIQKIFDRNNLLKRVIGDESLVKLLAREFLEDIPKQIDKIKNAILDSDQHMIIHQAHKIKGAAINLSGISLSELAYEIEKIAGKSSNHDELKKYIPLLEKEFAELKLELEKELN